jgi:hypothetical protein
MSIDQLIQPLLDQGVLGTLVIILLIMFSRIFKKLISVIENNTMAQTKSAEAQKWSNECIEENTKALNTNTEHYNECTRSHKKLDHITELIKDVGEGVDLIASNTCGK